MNCECLTRSVVKLMPPASAMKRRAVGLGLEIALDLGFPRIDLGDRAGDRIGVEGVVEHEESALVVRLRLLIADDFERRLYWSPGEPVIELVQLGQACGAFHS